MALGDERRASGRAMEQARRAGGARMEAERRGEDLAMDLQALAGPQQQRRSLSPIPARGGTPAARGRGTYVQPAGGGGAAGIASPLTEADAEAREYWPSGLRSSDGLFTLPAIKLLKLTDANGAEVEVQLADPRGAA
ncbi:hypothetical protein D3C78_237380 [compost metagenome]